MLNIKKIIMVTAALIIGGCADNQPINNDNNIKDVAKPSTSRIEHDFNHQWLFTLEDNHEFSQSSFNDKDWRSLNLPHDWSVEFSFTQEKADGATGYLPGGIGWYRKHFDTPKGKNKKHYINFDGIYNHAEIWLNGKVLGSQIYGYSPFYFDISEHLNPQGESNTIAVRVDRSRYIDSRWYTGSGIYRDVKLISTDPLHIPVWGTYVTTPTITDQKADVALAIEVNNHDLQDRDFTVVTDIIDTQGNVVASQASNASLLTGKSNVFNQTLSIQNPKRWDIESPYIYKAHTKLLNNGVTYDEFTTPFGVRDIQFDANTGFFLNGKSLKIKGVNLHHDAGIVGAAVPDDVWRRRLETLKAAGVNAIRTAHNPASESFLDLCDELGLLVQAEIFDEYDNPKDKRLNQQERHDDYISRGYTEDFQEQGETDLKASVKRDRNHPSIIMWSIGNEIEWTYPRYAKATGYFDMNAGGNYFFNKPFISPEEIVERFHSSEEGQYVLAETAKKLSKWVKDLDTTRPVTANLILPSVSHITGYTDALDIIGYSYRRVIYDYGHRLFPDKMIMGTENVVQWHEWKAIQERDFIAGTFLWTGIDYMGESHNKWPVKSTASGMLDLAGFDKPSYHMMKTLWDDTPHVHLTTQVMEKSLYKVVNNKVEEKKPGAWQKYVWYWHDVNDHWQYESDQTIAVEAYTNCEAVELFLNGKSLGIEQLKEADDHILKWAVDYQAGDLTAKGIGNCDAKDTIQTTGELAGISLTVDTNTTQVNRQRVVHVEVQLTDVNNKPITHKNAEVVFNIKGPAKVLGVDNGASNNVQTFQSNTIITAKGKALLILQAEDLGEILITASTNGIISNAEVVLVK